MAGEIIISAFRGKGDVSQIFFSHILPLYQKQSWFYLSSIYLLYHIIICSLANHHPSLAIVGFCFLTLWTCLFNVLILE